MSFLSLKHNNHIEKNNKTYLKGSIKKKYINLYKKDPVEQESVHGHNYRIMDPRVSTTVQLWSTQMIRFTDSRSYTASQNGPPVPPLISESVT